LAHPTAITIDFSMDNTIFWADHTLSTKEMMKRDGTGRTTGPRGDNINRPSSLDVFESTPYWISTGKGRTRATGPCSFAVVL
jgi:hypothetical protein